MFRILMKLEPNDSFVVSLMKKSFNIKMKIWLISLKQFWAHLSSLTLESKCEIESMILILPTLAQALVGAKTLKIKLKKSIISQHQTEALVPVKTEASPPQEATSTKLKLLSAPASTRKIPSHNVTNVVLHNRFDALQMS